MAITSQPMPLQTARRRRARVGRYFELGNAGLLAGAVVAVCILSILYLAQTGRVATRGHYLQQLQGEEKALLREAEQSEYRIAAAQRLTVVQERATKLGLRPATVGQTRYLQIEVNHGPIVAQR